ncbi:uncharacterized protein CEXT_249831 [Caerostris extrusa]|uniref:Uncharacterized protein n=1 Tax=Caerostris extrusa TaxID=172846 RepID=A0AAV4W799_CAEEX|nr:uncharacterized protein CEXT_249831 [Caerostris extrusa]
MQIQEKEKEWENKKFEEMKELYPFGRDTNNGGSFLSHADPMFMPTRPKKIIFQDDDFDPWGKGFGNPAWDQQEMSTDTSLHLLQKKAFQMLKQARICLWALDETEAETAHPFH